MTEQNFIGIEIGGTKLQLVYADALLKIQEHLSFEVDREKGAKEIQQQIEDGIHKIKGEKKLTAVGVGFGGPVDHRTGAISVSHQITGWENFNLRQWLQGVSEAPVYIDNDAGEEEVLMIEWVFYAGNWYEEKKYYRRYHKLSFKEWYNQQNRISDK